MDTTDFQGREYWSSVGFWHLSSSWNDVHVSNTVLQKTRTAYEQAYCYSSALALISKLQPRVEAAKFQASLDFQETPVCSNKSKMIYIVWVPKAPQGAAASTVAIEQPWLEDGVAFCSG